MIRVLSNLKGRADSKGVTAQMAWPALSNIMQNTTGQEIDYDSFKAEFDANPQMKELVDNFDENGIVIKTKAKKEQTGGVGDKTKSKNAVISSAKRAASKMIG